jgi:CheY-like chemotaxis protein
VSPTSRILVAEPDAALRQVLLRVLPGLGYAVDIAGSRSGLEHAAARRYDVLLLDAGLLSEAPGLLRAEPSPGSPRLVVTGWDPTARYDRGARGWPADAYVRKPFDIADLIAVLGPTAVPAAQPADPSTEQLYLRRSRLAIAISEDRQTSFLHVQSTVDPRQSFLLPLRDQLLSGGVSLYSRLGWLHAVYWGLAYGAGPLPEQATIQFEPSARRRVREPVVEVRPRMLSAHWWVADAEGSFETAAVKRREAHLGRIRLGDRW